jgi:hypothetical protein
MGSKARRTALSVAGIALAGGASLALAAPASAATHAGEDGYGNHQSSDWNAGYEQTAATSGTYTKVEKTELKWNTSSSEKAYAQGQNDSWDGDRGGYDGCDDGCDADNQGGHHWRQRHTRVIGYYRSYHECREAALRGMYKGWWDSYDCDFTKRGYQGWHKSWNKWGSNGWRCGGTWVLRAPC